MDDLKEGRDEMNLAEFPLSLLADRAGPDQRSLCFEDSIWDEGRKERVARKLTVTASAEHGLPTALDDEVLLGLVQLSRQRNFEDRKVPFTRYQLIELLGWSRDGRSYGRLEESLHRLGRGHARLLQRLVEPRGAQLGRRDVPRPRQRNPARPRTGRAQTAAGCAAALAVHLERRHLPELPLRQSQGPGLRVLSEPRQRGGAEALPVPRQTVLP